jgi:hypothetical protein
MDGDEGSARSAFFEVGHFTPIYFVSTTAHFTSSQVHSYEVTVARWDWRPGKKPRRAWKLLSQSGKAPSPEAGTLWKVLQKGGEVDNDDPFRDIALHPDYKPGVNLVAHYGDWKLARHDLGRNQVMARYKFGMHGDIALDGLQISVFGSDLKMLGGLRSDLAREKHGSDIWEVQFGTPFIVIDAERKLLNRKTGA